MLNVTQNNFKAEVLDNEGVVLVDFWAPWCGPCRMVGPILEQIAAENKDSVKIVKVNIDENPDLAEKFQVMSIPTMIVFSRGQKVDKFVGAQPKQGILRKLERWIA
jgi:thioredoxin 1